MKKTKIILLFLLFFLIFTKSELFAYSQTDTNSPEQIKIAILSGDSLYNFKQEISSAVKTKLNKTVVIKVLDYDTFLVDMERGNSDFYKGSPLTYVYSLQNTAILKSVYTINNEIKYDYLSVIIARKDKITSLKDLESGKFYFTNPNSASGYLYPKLFLAENNIFIEKEFADDKSPKAADVYKYVINGKWDACCSFYGLLNDDPLFKNNSDIKVFEIPYSIPNDPLWVNEEFKNEHPQIVNEIKTLFLDLFKDNKTVSFTEAHDKDYDGIRRKVRVLEIIENKDIISLDRLMGFITTNPKTLDFVLKYKLHFIFFYLFFIFIITVAVYMFFKRTVVKKYHLEHKLLNDKYNDLLKRLKEENDFNSKITELEEKIKTAFKDLKNFTEDSVIIKYIATGEFLYNKYKDTHAMEPSAIANCYVKTFERIVMVSAFGSEEFEKQDDTKVPDEEQNIKNRLNPKKILDNGIREVRNKAHLSNKEYKSLQKCKNIRNKVAHLKPVSIDEVVSLRKTLLGENSYTDGILAKLAPYLEV